MIKGGYIMIDCGGLNLLTSEPQTISGLYAKVKKAHELNKPIYAVNCVDGSGVKMSPIHVFTINDSGTMIGTASILQVRVASDDSVTITNLIIE
jgi:hypothetical protein